MYFTGDTFDDLLGQAKHMYDLQKKKADETIPKVMKFDSIPSFAGFYSSSLKVKGGYYSSDRDPVTVAEFDSCLEKYLTSLDEKEKEVTAKHEANKPMMENNKIIREKVSLIMRELGIPGTYQERDYKSKSRTPKYETRIAGYEGDLQRNVRIDDGYDLAIKSIQKSRLDAKSYVEGKRKELASKEAAEAKIKEEKRKEVVLVHLRVKYGADPEDSAKDVLYDHVLPKNKYLRLYHYLLANRGDWSEGYDYAEQGIDGFSIETEEDQRIYDAIRDVIDNSDGFVDGRVFRDMELGYGHIFGLVKDETLMADYNTLTSYIV